MLSLLYVSTAREGLSEAEVASIADSAAVKNAENEITGLLAYNSHSFMQLLEGSSSVVHNVMQTISRDERHSNIVYIRQQHRDNRECPDWSMQSLITPLDGLGSADAFTVSLPGEMGLDTKVLFTSFASTFTAQRVLDHKSVKPVFNPARLVPDND